MLQGTVKIKKKIRSKLIGLLCFAVLLSLFAPLTHDSQASAAVLSVGAGTELDPYIITTPEQLDAIRSEPLAHYKLGGNIDLTDYLSEEGQGYNSGKHWIPIPNFGGSLDGDGYVIKGLTSRNETGNIGFIRILGVGSIVENIGLVNVDISTTNIFAGGLAAELRGTVRSIYVTGNVTGLYAGGITAYLNGGEIINSFSTANVTSTENQAGGLSGMLYRGSITNSYAAGDIAVSTFGSGGLVGFRYPAPDDGTIVDSFYDAEVSGQDDVDKGEGKSTADLHTSSTFTAWNLADTWIVKEGQYPHQRIFLAETPEADVASGAVTWNTAVSLSSATPGAAIHYTTNGDDPTTDSSLYVSPILVSEDMTIKAIAVKGQAYLDVMNRSYTVIGKPAAPTSGSLAPGTDYDTTQLQGVTDAMEYKINNGNYMAVATGATSIDNIVVQAGDIISLRAAAASETPASEVQQLTVDLSVIKLGSMSTLTATLGTVSTGGTANEMITNIPYGTTLADFKAAITPAERATFKVYEADGATVATALATGWQVVVTAQDTTTTTYSITMQLAPPMGYLSPGTNADTTRLNGVTEDMEYKVNEGEYISVEPDDVTVDNIVVQAGDVISVRIAATLDIMPSAVQELTVVPADITPKSTVSTVTSSIGTVSSGGSANETVTDIPYGTTLADFKAALSPAAFATFEIYEADGITVATALATGHKVIVTAQDATTITTYTITIAPAPIINIPTTPNSPTPAPEPSPTPETSPTPTAAAGNPVFNDKVNRAVVAEVKKKAESAAPTTFTDVEPTSWSYADIDFAAKAGIVEGYEDGTFRGNESITRGQFALMLANAFGFRASGAQVIADATGHFAENAIRALWENAIMTGYSNGNFEPNRKITRAEIAALLSRILDSAHLNFESRFEDINDSWAMDAINALGNAGIINGKNEQQFAPDANASREEAVALIVRLINLVPNE